jgi:hypothetical protein
MTEIDVIGMRGIIKWGKRGEVIVVYKVSRFGCIF